MSELCLIYSTFSTETEANKAASVLLNENLIACANIFPNMKSVYRWKGKTESDSEVAVYFKTFVKKYSDAREKLESIHPYECPCILQLKIDDVNPAYKQWVSEQLPE